MGYKFLGQPTGSCSKICRVIPFIGALWIILDMISDGMTVKTYREECMAGSLPCFYWQLGVFFLLLPTIMSILWIWCLSCCCGQSNPYCWKTLVYGLGYALYTPIYAMYTTGGALFCGNTAREDKDTQNVSTLKLYEQVFEALPQVIVTIYQYSHIYTYL